MTDSVSVTGFRRTVDGYLAGEARVARSGVQIYLGKELGMADRDEIRVYRPPEEVFKQDSLSSYAHRPVTMGHPSQMVDSTNWKKTAIGQTGEEVLVDGQSVRVPLVLMDESAIKNVESGAARQLSMGYTCDLEFVDGTSPEGERYDAVQRNLRMNHLAVVPLARGGSTLRIGDTKEKTDMADNAIKTRTVLVDGLPIETNDAGAVVIERLQKQLADASDGYKKMEADKDAEIAGKDAEIDELKKKSMSDADVDARVQQRADLLVRAKALAPTLSFDGKSDADIRRTVVAHKIGDAAIAGKTEAYVDARFDILAEDSAPTDPVKQVLRDGVKASVSAVDSAYAENISHLQNAWKGNK